MSDKKVVDSDVLFNQEVQEVEDPKPKFAFTAFMFEDGSVGFGDHVDIEGMTYRMDEGKLSEISFMLNELKYMINLTRFNLDMNQGAIDAKKE